ncbi:MAG: CarD family transcriptional regulator [Bacilli bacterium]|nr:CarD family transcriptional regulator [Bacilli bacterium]
MNDYKIGQQVIHCRDGLAVVVGSTNMADKDYYIVKTVRGSGENIYVPVDRADQIIRFLMSSEEADKLIAYIKTIPLEFNPNTKQRRDAIKKRLLSGDVKDSAYLFKQLFFFKAQNDGSIKFGALDIDMLSFASNNLLDEFAISYNKNRDEIEEFVFAKLK